jgi:UDP-GlcNAc:undecaprenyl-phosphate GlcNAc-1-phosphate transferase
VLTYSFIWLILKTPAIHLFCDKPGVRRLHQRVIPRIGGVAILCGFILLLHIWNYLIPFLPKLPSDLLSSLTFASVAILLVGLADDMVVVEIQNKAKFILELVIATEIVVLNGIQLNEIHFLGWDFSLGWYAIPVTVIWIVGVTNAINIIDGVDGLAGSIVFVSFATIAILTGFSGDVSIFILSVVLAGLVAGFLMHNISPARVFLGDTGSLFLGIIIGVLSIYLVSKPSSRYYPLPILFLLVGLPLLDVFGAMTRRFMKKIFAGAHWFKALGAMSVADNEHMHHRLIYQGLTHTETVTVLVLFHAVICMSAIMVSFTSNIDNLVMFVYIGFVASWFLYKLHFFDRFTTFFRNRKQVTVVKRLSVVVVNAGDVLKYSLEKYDQRLFSFVFQTKEEFLIDLVKCCAVIIEQSEDESIEEGLALAGSIFMQNTCPVLLVSSTDEQLTESFSNLDGGSGAFLLIKRPIYIPVLLRETSRLIKQSRGWLNEKVTTDTRQFFLQAATHEEI